MYRLYYGSEFLFDPYTDNTVYDAKLTAKTNTSDYLDFTVPYGHDLYDSLAVKAETVKLYWDKDCLYVGTIESIETDIQGNLDVTCTGALDWLADSVVRPYSTVEGEQPLTAPTSVDGLFEWYITQHNEHCLDTRKQFSVGENQGALLDDNNYIYRSNESTPTTLDEVQDKIIDELGGYLFVNYEPLTIDLYADVHTTNAQIIDFGVNITDFTSTTDTSEQYTAIRPEGATPESEEGSEETQRPITIEGLADGGVEGYSDLWKVGDVVYSVSGVARYGYREYAYSNTDCTTEQGLLTSACKKLNAILSPDLSITVKAVDLSLFMEGYTHLKVGEAVRVRSKFHGIDEYLMVQSIELDLQDPSQSTYELGAEYSTLTGQQSTYLKNLNSNINTALDATSALSDETKAAASEAKDAKTQAAEAKAAADAAVVSNVAQWATTADPATKPAEGDWSADAPDYEAGKYIWLRNVITYGSGDTTTTDGVCITGNTGKGVKGDNAYVHIAYANSEDGKTDFSVDDPVGKSYIGQYSDNLEDDSTDPTKYAWTKIKGEQGKQGVSPTVTTSKSGGTTTIKITDADGTKTATVNDGATGNGIKSVTEHYQVSTSNTTAPTSWQDTVPTMTATSKYLWNYETIAYTDGTTSDSKKRVIGVYGTKGDSGKGVASIVEQYYQSTSATAQTGGSWSGTYPGWADGKYIWTRSVITYTDSTTTTTTPVCVTGSKGGSGDKGTSITSVDVQYYQSTSATALSGGSWSTTAPAWASGKYIWTKTVTTYSTGSTSESNPACITGQKGSNGATGTSVSSIVNHYLATSASSGVTTSTSGWTTTVQAVSADKKYLWNYETVNYKAPASSADTTPCIIGTYGDTGKGVKSVAVTYQSGTSGTTAPTGTWSSSIPTVTKGQYLWTKTVTTYTDSATSTGYSVSYQPTNGTNGTSVTISSTSVTYQASTSGTTTPTGTWSTSVPTVSNGSYLWTKTVVTYSTGTSTTSYSVSYKGTNGTNGTSATIKSTAVTYQASTSGTTVPTGTWSTSVPTVTQGQYLWTKTVVNYSPSGSTTSYAVAYQAKDGEQGERGFSILKVTTAPTAYTTKVGTFTPSYRIALSTVKTQSSATEVLVGDVLQYSYWQYKVGYVDASYVYTAARSSIRGATGTSVTKVAVTYGLSTSNASDGYSSVTSWTTDIPDWTSGKYIWQKSVTTIGTTAQTPVYALYGAFNSLASTVDGHTTLIKQQGDSIALKANSTDVANDIATAKQSAISTAATDATTKANSALSDAKTYADSQIKVSADSITSTVASTYETLTDAATIKTTAQTASSKITQTANALGVTFGTSKATGTLIKADSTGIEVGYSSDGSSFASTHTKMGTDAFSIHDKSHNKLASFGTEAVVGQTTGGNVQITSSAVNIRSKTTNMASITSSQAVIGSTSGTNKNVLLNGSKMAFRQGTTEKAAFQTRSYTDSSGSTVSYLDIKSASESMMLYAGTTSSPKSVYLTAPPDSSTGYESDMGLGLLYDDSKTWHAYVATSDGAGNLADWVVTKDTVGIWTYEEWASGKLVMYGTKTWSPMSLNKTYNGWRYYDGAFDNFPVLCKEVPKLLTNLNQASGLPYCFAYGLSTSGFNVNVANSSYVSATFAITALVIGRWR